MVLFLTAPDFTQDRIPPLLGQATERHQPKGDRFVVARFDTWGKADEQLMLRYLQMYDVYFPLAALVDL
jgi:hypothetical protein